MSGNGFKRLQHINEFYPIDKDKTFIIKADTEEMANVIEQTLLDDMKDHKKCKVAAYMDLDAPFLRECGFGGYTEVFYMDRWDYAIEKAKDIKNNYKITYQASKFIPNITFFNLSEFKKIYTNEKYDDNKLNEQYDRLLSHVSINNDNKILNAKFCDVDFDYHYKNILISEYNVGDKVLHMKYGYGKLNKIYSTGKVPTYSVKFPQYQQNKNFSDDEPFIKITRKKSANKKPPIVEEFIPDDISEAKPKDKLIHIDHGQCTVLENNGTIITVERNGFLKPIRKYVIGKAKFKYADFKDYKTKGQFQKEHRKKQESIYKRPS